MELNRSKLRLLLGFLLLSGIALSFASCKKEGTTIPIGVEETETIPSSTDPVDVSADHPLFTMQEISGAWMITGLTSEGANADDLTIPASWKDMPVTRVSYLMSTNLRTLRTEEGAELSFDRRSIASLPELTELVLLGTRITVGDFCFTDCPKLLAIQTGEGSVVTFGNAVANGNQDPLYIMFLDQSRVTIGRQSFLKTGSLSLGKNTELNVAGSSFSEGGMLYLSEKAKLSTGDYVFSDMQSVTLEAGAAIQAGAYCFSALDTADLMEGSSWRMGAYCLSRSETGSRITLGPSTVLQGGIACLGSVATLTLDQGAKLELGSRGLHASGNTATLTMENDAVMTLGDESLSNFKQVTLNGTASITAGNRSFCGYSATLSLSMGSMAAIQAGNGCFQNVWLLNLAEGCRLSAGDYAFAYSDSLTSLTLPRSITLGEFAFAHCQKLTSLRLQDGYNDIASHSFYGCPALTRVDIPASVTHIGGYAFENTSESLTIHGKNGSVADYYATENHITFHAE